MSRFSIEKSYKRRQAKKDQTKKGGPRSTQPRTTHLHWRAVITLAFTTVVTVFLSSCSDAPDQYRSQEPPENGVPKLPDTSPLSKVIDSDPPPVGSGVDKDDELTRKNAREKIIFGVGAAGITFDTPLEDAEKLLSRPSYGPDSDGLAGYNSGVWIQWRTTEPIVPEFFELTNDYLGGLDLGHEFGTWHLDEDLSQYFLEDPTGAKLLTRLVQILENKPADYDCIKGKTCAAVPLGKDTIVLVSRSIWFFISGDRKTLFSLRLMNKQPEGRTTVPFDIYKGRFEIAAQNDLPGSSIQLSQVWADVLKAQAEDTKTTVATDGFVKEYEGVSFILTKSKYDVSYQEPAPYELLRIISLNRFFEKPLMVNGKYVEIQEKGSAIDLQLVASDTGGRPILNMNPRLHPDSKRDFGSDDLRVDFVKKLAGLFKTELANQFSQTAAQIQGLYQLHGPRSLISRVAAYDPNKKAGRIIDMVYEESTMSISNLGVANVLDPADHIIFSSLSAPAPIDRGSLSGFKLGQVIELSDIDLTRGEATVHLPEVPARGESDSATSTTLQKGVSRGNYSDNTYLNVSYDGAAEVAQKQHVISLGIASVRLGLIPLIENLSSSSDSSDRSGAVEAGPSSETSQKKRFIVTSIGSNFTRVENLCGVEGLSVNVGDEEFQFIKNLSQRLTQKAMDEAQDSKVKHIDCSVMKVKSGNGNGRYEAVYFPSLGLKVGFQANEVSAISIYGEPAKLIKAALGKPEGDSQ